MPIKIYNTLTRSKEEFQPRDPGKVSMYVCGVTPYAPAHVGHGRHAVVFDTVRRWLIYRGFSVTYIMNITDVEDKIIAASYREGREWREVADQYTASYWRDLSELNVLFPTMAPKASEHIADIIGLIERLIACGAAYVLERGDVVFHVPSFPGYGRLSRRDLDSQIIGARVEEDACKRDARDFFLWKAAKSGEPSWDSPWGQGRPGWHIECSAMSSKYLGERFDIHGGGTDLIFPHHENEIAQFEACGGLFARIWMHNGMLLMSRGGPGEAEKMSKSLGNVIALGEALKRVGGTALRYYYIAAHYGSDIPFTEEALEQAQGALERLRIGLHTLDRLVAAMTKPNAVDLPELAEAVERATADFEEAMDDDFSTPRALAALHGLVGAINRVGAKASATFAPSEKGQANLLKARETLLGLASVLGLTLEQQAAPEQGLVNELIKILITVREKARNAKYFELADEVRTRLGELGIALEDRSEGTNWRRR